MRDPHPRAPARLPLVAAVLAALAVVLPVSGEASSTERVGPAGVPTTTAPFDQQFIDMMAMHHQMAIDMARMAAQHASHPELRTLARGIVSAQSRELGRFHALRQRWYGVAAFHRYRLDAMMQRMMGMPPDAAAMPMHGAALDRGFLEMMVPHHAGAITMAQWERDAGTHRELKQIAAQEISSQGREIGTMLQLRRRWFGA
jgi:uncharacterized protein (DUF305 family)